MKNKKLSIFFAVILLLLSTLAQAQTGSVGNDTLQTRGLQVDSTITIKYLQPIQNLQIMGVQDEQVGGIKVGLFQLNLDYFAPKESIAALQDSINAKADTVQLHTHANKTILDDIDAAKIANWDNDEDTQRTDEEIKDVIASENYAKTDYVNTQDAATLQNAKDYADSIEIGGRNLLSTNVSSWETGVWRYSSGKKEYEAGWSCTKNKFAIEPGQTYIITSDIRIRVMEYKADSSYLHVYNIFDPGSYTFRTSDSTALVGVYKNCDISDFDTNQKLEKGNKPTAWTPAIEDQISDWNETNSEAFSYIKNKPTKLSDFENDLATDKWVHSESDFVNGTLVQTSIDVTTGSTSSFIIEISGKSYIQQKFPFKVVAEGYFFRDEFIAISALSYGGDFANEIKYLKDNNGKLAIWWKRLGYWQSFNVHVRNAKGTSANHVTSIVDSVEPESEKKVSVPVYQNFNNWNFKSGVDYATPGELHTHDNKALLDNIVATDTARWAVDTNTQLTDAEIAAMGYKKTVANISTLATKQALADTSAFLKAYMASRYLTNDALSGYATESWVNSRGFLKSVNITGNESVFESWDKDANDDVKLTGDQTISGLKIFNNTAAFLQGALFRNYFNILNIFEVDFTTGQLKFNQYTGTKFDATPSYYLGVDANGNVVKTSGGAGSGTVLIANRAAETNADGNVIASPITNTELRYLDGATSNIQDQINALTTGTGADGNNYPTLLDFDVSTGILKIERNGIGDLVRDLDGRYVKDALSGKGLYESNNGLGLDFMNVTVSGLPSDAMFIAHSNNYNGFANPKLSEILDYMQNNLDFTGGAATIPDASYSTKGKASFDSNYFTVSSGHVGLGAGAVKAMHVDNSIISGKSALTSGLLGTDEMLISDGGITKRMDVSVLQSYMQSNLTFGDGAVDLSNYYTKTEADSRYKPAAWLPTWSDISNKPVLFTQTDADARYLKLTGGTLTGNVIAPNFVLSSDRRLKENIQPLKRKINDIQFKEFNFKNDTTQRYGVIAQEVQKIAPELVVQDKNGNLAISYIDLLVLKIAELEQRIKELEDEK